MTKNNDHFFDIRTYKRNIEQGFIKEEDFKKFLSHLPDDAANSEVAPFEDPEETLEVSFVPDEVTTSLDEGESDADQQEFE